jgi:transposase-like protein
MYLWRAVDDEGEVLAILVQTRRTKRTARKLLPTLRKKQHMRPESIGTDGLTSYGAAISELGCADRRRPSRLQDKSRAENSHLPIG